MSKEDTDPQEPLKQEPLEQEPANRDSTMEESTQRPWWPWHSLRTWVGREVATLAILMLLAGSIWGFVAVADEVIEGDTHEIDRRILLALRVPGQPSDPIGPHWFEEMARDFTALGGVGVLAGLSAGVCGYLLLRREYALFLLLASAALGAILLSLSLKYAFDRPRPDLVPHEAYVYTRSFPSGHSMMSTSIYLMIGVLLAKVEPRRIMRAYLFSVAIVIALLVGASRVYLGVHWPTDVLAGWAAGAAWAAVCYLLADWLRRLSVRRNPSSH